MSSRLSLRRERRSARPRRSPNIPPGFRREVQGSPGSRARRTSGASARRAVAGIRRRGDPERPRERRDAEVTSPPPFPSLGQEKEDALTAERTEAAAEALEELETTRRDKIKNVTMAANRQKEHEYLEEIERQLENENPWERVGTLVDFQLESSDDVCDVSRLRTLLIQKKNDHEKSARAA